jgi:hypothetical protein
VFAIHDCDALAIVFPTTPEECEKVAQGFSNISKEGCISNCVAVLDGYHLEICTPPPKTQVGNVHFSSLVIIRLTVLTCKLLVIITVTSCSLEWLARV